MAPEVLEWHSVLLQQGTDMEKQRKSGAARTLLGLPLQDTPKMGWTSSSPILLSSLFPPVLHPPHSQSIGLQPPLFHRRAKSPGAEGAPSSHLRPLPPRGRKLT